MRGTTKAQGCQPLTQINYAKRGLILGVPDDILCCETPIITFEIQTVAGKFQESKDLQLI